MEDVKDTVAERALATDISRIEKELKKKIEWVEKKASIARECQRDHKD